MLGLKAMPSLIDVFPDAKTLLALQPEELGDVILELIHQGISSNPGLIGPSDILTAVNSRDTPQWPFALRSQVTNAVWEAIFSLQHAGFIMLDPSQGSSMGYWRILTRRGQLLHTRQQSADYRHSAILPEGLVHPDISKQVSGSFLRGDYDIAVFSAFKAVEIAVRKRGGYAEGELGAPLMRKAFAPATGPLTDATLEGGEQEAQSHLFAGAIGAAKNPASHRDVEMGSAEAARLILFASYLLSIVDSRPK
jgi:uncharacterized protein (TIGR02391 family)